MNGDERGCFEAIESAFLLRAASMDTPGFGWTVDQEHASVFLVHRPSLEFGVLNKDS